MPNFEVSGGVTTRIAVQPRPGSTFCRVRLGGVHVEAVVVDFDTAGWQSEILSQWPPWSPAWQCYWKRIAHGPSYLLARDGISDEPALPMTGRYTDKAGGTVVADPQIYQQAAVMGCA